MSIQYVTTTMGSELFGRYKRLDAVPDFFAQPLRSTKRAADFHHSLVNLQTFLSSHLTSDNRKFDEFASVNMTKTKRLSQLRTYVRRIINACVNPNLFNIPRSNSFFSNKFPVGNKYSIYAGSEMVGMKET